jgi:hypothetical protein
MSVIVEIIDKEGRADRVGCEAHGGGEAHVGYEARGGGEAGVGHEARGGGEAHGLARWAASGLMALSGQPGGGPSVLASDLMSRIDALLSLLNQRCASVGSEHRYDIRLLTERATLSGLTRGGRESCNRSCRLIETRDGWVALNLPRDSDWQSLPALMGCYVEQGSWTEVISAARNVKTDELVAKGRLLGLPIAAAIVPGTSTVGTPTFIASRGENAVRLGRVRDWEQSPPLVVDLSALWAGPLCGQILAACGARVIKVESIGRPDSIRQTSPEFFDLLNAGKESVALDFDSGADLERLGALIKRADLVISSARPRAFEQLDLAPEALMQSNPKLNWVAITAYGWHGESRNAVGFGDDVAVAAGLTSWCDGQPSFIADAIADPLTGIAAAAAAIEAIGSGRADGAHIGIMIDASLYASASYVATADVMTHDPADTKHLIVSEPQARPGNGRARAFGSDTTSLLRELT